MFKFDFDIDDAADDEFGQSFNIPLDKNNTEDPIDFQPFCEVYIPDLLDRLPSILSYSPLHVPLLPNLKALTLVRRDLFDARFQLIAETGVEVDEVGGASSSVSTPGRSALEFLEAPSDLVPRVYEGGLKTWEASLDLVQYLDTLGFPDEALRGKRILEIGCGTAVPSLYLLRRLLTTPPANRDQAQTHIHLQDYNTSVLELVTFPNILLTWYISPAAASYREREHNIEDTSTPDFDPSVPSELQITPELKTGFLASLQDHGVSLRFFSSSWDTFDLPSAGGRYDVVLTSETIYRPESLPSLVALMRAASMSTLPKDPQQSIDISHSCLVAAKVIYFGVGGGVSEFVNAVSDAKQGKVETVWESNVGVGRKVMRVEWM